MRFSFFILLLLIASCGAEKQKLQSLPQPQYSPMEDPKLPSSSDVELDKTKKKLDEVEKNLDYIRRYVGPNPNP